MSTKVYDILKPANNGKFPVYEDVDGYGGFQVRATFSELSSIPSANKKQGMMAYVVADSSFYQLGADKTTWSKAVFTSNADPNTFGTIKLTGDLSGTAASPIVSKINGKLVDNTGLTTNYVLTYDSSANGGNGAWLAKPAQSTTVSQATAINSGTVKLAGDLGGTGSTADYPIIKIAGKDVDTSVTLNNLSNDGYVLTWNASSTKWKPSSIPTASSSSFGAIKLSGDLYWPSSNPSAPTVSGIINTPIDLSVTLDEGYILAYTSSPAIKWLPQRQSYVKTKDNFIVYSPSPYKEYLNLSTSTGNFSVNAATSFSSSVNIDGYSRLNNYVSINNSGIDADYYSTTDTNTFIRWTFDDASSSTTCSNSGNSSVPALTKYNGASNSSPGVIGTSAYTAGTAYLSTTSTSINPNSTNITVSLWVKSDYAAQSSLLSYGEIFKKDYSAGTASISAFRINRSSYMGWWSVSLYIKNLGVSVNNSVYISDYNFTLKDNTWQFIAFTYDGTTIKAYVNGQLAGSTLAPGVIDYGTSSNIGPYLVGGTPDVSTLSLDKQVFGGYIDDIRVENTVRSADYLLDLYQKISNKFHSSAKSMIKNDIIVDGAITTQTNLDYDLYTYPDSNTLIQWKFDEYDGLSTGFLNTGTSSISNSTVPVLQLSRTGTGGQLYSTSAGFLAAKSLYVNLPSTGSYLSAPSTITPSTTSITVSCWVKILKFTTTWQSIFHKKLNNDTAWTSPNYSSLEMSVAGNDGTWYVRVLTGTTGSAVIFVGNLSGSPYKIPLNKWCLLSFTYNGTTGTIIAYFNGIQAGTMTLAAADPKAIRYGTGPYLVGSHSVSPNYVPFNGFISDLRVENTIRTQTYLESMYKRASSLIVQDNIGREVIGEIKNYASKYPINSRIYAENIGNIVLSQNAVWDGKNWNQERNQSPSTIVSFGPNNVTSGYDGYDHNFNRSYLAVTTKDPNSPSWTNSSWNKNSFELHSGAATMLADTSKKFNYASIYVGPPESLKNSPPQGTANTPPTTPGFGQIEIRGNTYSGTSEFSTGGPRLLINSSYPTQAKTDPNTLYSANILKSMGAFFYSPYGTTDVTLGPDHAFKQGIVTKDIFISNFFNVASIRAKFPSEPTGYYEVTFKNAISSMVVNTSIDYNWYKYSDGSSYVDGLTSSFYTKYLWESDYVIRIYVLDSCSRLFISPDFLYYCSVNSIGTKNTTSSAGRPFIHFTVFGIQ